MRRVNTFLTTLLLAALLLAACGGQETSTSVPSTNVPPVTVESTSTMEATEAPTEAPTEAMTTTPAVPVTGGNSPAQVSNLIGTPICGMGGDQLGAVQDLVLDFDQTMVSHVIVDSNGRTVAVPWTSMTMPTAGGTGTGTGTGTLSTDTPAAGTSTLGTDTPSASTGTLSTETPAAGTGTGTGTGSSQGSANCLTLTVDNDTFDNAPAFDTTTLPTQGQPATGWDTSISGYWANPSAGGTGGTGTTSTDTPSAGGASSASTAVPTTTSSTGTGSGTGTATGQGAQQMQGVMLATDILGATVTVSPQGNDAGTGTGNQASATATTTGGTGVTSTDTPSAGTGSGTGTTTGDFSQGTVQDLIIEPMTGDIQYLVVRFGSQENWIPIPIGFLSWDSTTNGFVLRVNSNALQNAPAFSADQFPDTSMSGWDQEFSTFWQNNGDSGSGTGTGSGGTTDSTATATP